MKIFISEQGGGDGTGKSSEEAIAWENGRGVELALKQAKPNDDIILRAGTYRLDAPINWHKSGRHARPIRLMGEGTESSGKQYGQSVQQVSGTWPKIVGGESGGGIRDFIRFQPGTQHIAIEQLNLHNFDRCFVAENGPTQGITVQNIQAENLRQFAVIIGGSKLAPAHSWHFSRCHLTGVSNGAVYLNAVQNASFYDIYADCKGSAKGSAKDFAKDSAKDFPNQLQADDAPLLFHCEGSTQDVRFERCCGVNPVCSSSGAESGARSGARSGGSFAIAQQTQRIQFTRCIAYQPSHTGFDIKGHDHELHHCYVEQAGSRAYQLEGNVILAHCIAECQSQATGENTANGATISSNNRSNDALNGVLNNALDNGPSDRAAIGINNGAAIVSGFTGRDMERPIAVDGSGSVHISDSRFELHRQFRNHGYSLRSRIKQNGSIRENNVKYQLL
jgi:hypothetical protein